MNINEIRKRSISSYNVVKENERMEIKIANQVTDDAFKDTHFLSTVTDLIERTANGELIGKPEGGSNPFMVIIPVRFKHGVYYRTQSDNYLCDKMRRYLGSGFRCQIWGSESVKVSWDTPNDWN